MGTTVTLECQVEGGNPLATLTWQCQGSTIVGRNLTYRTTAASSLMLNMDKTFHKQRCVCTAGHQASPEGLFGTKSVRFNILYPPTGNIVMWPFGTYSFQAGTIVTLNCWVEGGNPLATLTWQCKGSTVVGQNLTYRTKSHSRLELKVDKTYHQQKCLCTARQQASPNGWVGTVSVQFNILYKPIITLDSSTAYINESVDFRRICKAEGNPSPSVAWYRGTTFKKSNGILSIPRIDRTDAASYVCTATAGFTENLQSTERFMLVVQYGPDVNLIITNTTENATNVRLFCIASGVPSQYTYRWKHMLGSTVIRDMFDQVTSLGSVSTLTIPRVTYEDMGTYVCEASNGYRGRDGQIAQTRQDFLYVKGRPQAISVHNTYVTDKGTSLDINITYISFPEALNTSILRGGSTLPPKGELSVTVSSVPVTVLFFNKNVSIDGYIVQLHFSTFETRHQGRYQLYVWNEYTYYYDFEIIISDKPDHPTGLLIDQITESSAVVSWTPGEDNGNIQTFTLTCQENNGEFHTNITLNHSISSFTVENLDLSTEYDVTVFASNAMGTSEPITSTFSTISAEADGWNAAIIGGAASSASATILIACVIVVLIRRRKKSSEPKHTETESDDTNVACTARSNYDNDGLKDNILYESAGPYSPQQPGPSTGNRSGDVYAVVNKSKAKANVAETKLYAEVNKPKKGAQESAMYAEVQKTGKAQKVEIVVHSPAKEVTKSSEYAEVKKKKRGIAAKNDGLKDNVLYESAGPYYPQQPGPSTGNQSGDVFAVVNKSKAKANVAETKLYAEVIKPKKGAQESAMYAEVQKTGKAQKDGAVTDHDGNGDGTDKQRDGRQEDI
ncbi:Nephrin [Mizuhopecten yessoensis]|uniref:Nephrin n=2 Tax=Mizuhopecten yessoensis TaxID=6573 RepID=A0A210QKT1_MIZYE|nr:Nephrin [Mizuhopecten yessoensis]